MKAMIAKMVSEESAIFKSTANHAQAASYEPAKGGSFFGKLIKLIIFLAIIGVGGYFALVTFMPDHAITQAVSNIVSPLLDRAMQ